MRRTAALVLGLSLLAGCASDSSPKAAPSASSATPSDSPSPTESPTPGPVTFGAVFYSDTFKDKTKGWPERSTASATYTYHTDYATPLYTMTAHTPSLNLFPHPEFRGITRAQLTDYEVRATIQTTLSVGREDYLGVMCRDLDGKRYTFELGYDTFSDDGLPWLIAKRDQNGPVVLARGHVPKGGSAFTIGGACVGGTGGTPATLVMSVNGKEVGRAEDASEPFAQGYGGVYLYSKKGRTTVNVLDFAARPASLS